MGRRVGRVLAIKLLYQREITEDKAFRPHNIPLGEGRATLEERQFALSLAEGVYQHRTSINELIQRHSPEWRVERMPLVDRLIMWIAAYEMLHVDEIPLSVSINEAVELAKEYGMAESPRFVNGVLGSMAEEITGEAGTSNSH